MEHCVYEGTHGNVLYCLLEISFNLKTALKRKAN